MKTTIAALRELQAYWASLPPDQRPSIRKVSAAAGLSYPTTARYLNGETKEGFPDKVRALARALGREDIMNEVTAPAPTNNTEAWWLVEAQRIMREEYTEQFERERKEHEQTVGLLNKKIAELESEKATLATDLAYNRKAKHKYEALTILLLLGFLLYIIIFDLPHPDFDLPHPDFGLTSILK